MKSFPVFHEPLCPHHHGLCKYIEKAVAGSWQKAVQLGGLDKRITTPQCKKQLVTECYTGPWTWTDTLESPRQWKMDIRL